VNHDLAHKINRLWGLALTIEREGERCSALAELDEQVRECVIANLPPESGDVMQAPTIYFSPVVNRTTTGRTGR
jgi:hypothetical protein